VRIWTWHGPQPARLAWSGDHALDFTSFVPVRHRVFSGMYRLHVSGAAVAGSPALLHRTLVSFGGLGSRSPWGAVQLVTTDSGQTAFLTLASGYESRAKQVILRMNARTGRPLAVLPGQLTGWSHDGLFCGVLWTDGSGRRLVYSCGPGGRSGGFTAIGPLLSAIDQDNWLPAWGG